MRKALVQAIYAWLMETDAPEEVLDEVLAFHGVSPADRDHAHALFQGVVAHAEEADATLARLIEHWSLERVGMVERAVCHLALHELRHDPSLPVEVIVDEAVRLAKEYAGTESAHFVNGVLDTASRSLRPRPNHGEPR